MIVSRGFPPARPRGTRPLAATIGVFDGVHRGHVAVLRATLRAAARLRGAAMVITFDRHPLATLAPRRAPRPLMALEDRLAAFARMGFRAAAVLPFSRRIANLPAETFVRRVLAGRLRLRTLVVGWDFRCGRGGRGTAPWLVRMGPALGTPVRIVPPVRLGGAPVSSTRIRVLLARGRLAAAARLLGRPVTMSGIHVRGRRLARRLGFPTINLRPGEGPAPRYGIYAVRLGGRPGVANFGVRPTVERRGVAPLLEVHVLGRPPASRPGGRHTVELVRFLRPERRFGSLGALARAIARDAARARAILHLTPGRRRG